MPEFDSAAAHCPDPSADPCSPYDICEACGQGITLRDGKLVTMLSGNPECPGTRLPVSYYL